MSKEKGNEIISDEQKLYVYDEAYNDKYFKERPWEKE